MATISTQYGGMTIPVLDPSVAADPVAKNTLGSTPEEIRASFIQLLVASMQNQDPLNPTDSKDMTSQLAQIQGLESQEQMNTKLDALVASINAGQSYSLVSAIGRYAKVEANQMTLDASGAAASVVADAGYQSIEVALRDAAGKLVATSAFDNVPPGDMDFSWGGVDSAGNKLAYGTYNIAATGVSANGTRVALKVNPLVKVDGVVNDAGAWKLKLSDGKTVAQADVKGIY